MNFFKILAGLLPFVAFGVLAPHLGAAAAAGIGVGVSVVVIAATARNGVSSMLVVQGITLLAMALVALAGGPGVARYGPAVAALVLGGFMLATAKSHPFTAQTSRQEVPREFWHNPLFVNTNRKISIAWGLATAFLGACHLITAIVLPGIIVQILLMWVLPVVAMYFAVRATRRIAGEAAAQRSKIAASMAAAQDQGATAK